MANWQLYGDLSLIAFVMMLVFGICIYVHIVRLRRHESSPLAEHVGGTKAVLDKLRKGESMSPDELAFAKQTIADRRSLLAFAIPAAVFSLGCFYVFGSLEQLHGTTPSERAFIGLIPMVSSLNITAQLLRIGKLKSRLPQSA